MVDVFFVFVLNIYIKVNFSHKGTNPDPDSYAGLSGYTIHKAHKILNLQTSHCDLCNILVPLWLIFISILSDTPVHAFISFYMQNSLPVGSGRLLCDFAV
jgi:hypothetical protein